MTTFSERFIEESLEVLSALSAAAIEQCAEGLAAVRESGGRLFILGVGGSAGHASHAVNDFRKLCQFEAYSPTDNVSELTARTNDEGWDTTFEAWLRGSRLNSDDAVLIFSVGGEVSRIMSRSIWCGPSSWLNSGGPASTESWAGTAARPRRWRTSP